MKNPDAKHATVQWKIVAMILVLALLAASITQNIWYNSRYSSWRPTSYLQRTDEIYVMEAGILQNNLEFQDGIDWIFQYDFSHESYPSLIAKYHIDQTAGDGSEFDRALRLMDEYAPRLTHKGDFDYHIEMSATALLEYSLDQSDHGINCRCKAQILNEMCLALGIYARKLWISPYSGYDPDCHVVNEIWDTGLNKWIMLDITNNQYWVDENGTPLSVLEIREKGAAQEFCTPVEPGDSLSNLQALQHRHMGEFLYIMKNMVYLQYCSRYTIGEVWPILGLFPAKMEGIDEVVPISREAVERSPLQP